MIGKDDTHKVGRSPLAALGRIHVGNASRLELTLRNDVFCYDRICCSSIPDCLEFFGGIHWRSCVVESFGDADYVGEDIRPAAVTTGKCKGFSSQLLHSRVTR